jgi:holo-[acyl-carrier protein] synthase
MRGIGIDLVEIKRITEAISPAFLERLFTPLELEAGAGHRGKRQGEFWAGRFAGKEAVAKALGMGFGSKLSWQEIEILANRHGAPQVQLSGKARVLARSSGIAQILISITHTEHYAMALALATERREDNETGHS